MNDSSAAMKNRQLQIDFEQVYGISKFMLFLADKLTDDEYERLLKYQYEYYEQLTEESQHSS